MIHGLAPVGAPAWVRIVSAPAPGRRKFGVPPGGPFDPISAALAADLLGQDRFESGFEVLLMPAEFRADEDVWVAVAGAADEVAVGGTPSPTPWVGVLSAGQILTVGSPSVGCRTYLVSRLDAPPPKRARRPASPPIAAGSVALRVWRGPQAEWLDFEAFCRSEFSVSHLADRVGIRLDGPRLFGAVERPSEPACVGAVQVTPSGQAIVLGPDGPTIGGYPKIAVVASDHLPWLGQLVPGQGVRFEPVD
ncbi:MAG: biotin-dependent carboxyltransferase family protein [Fimbriimonadaceae bacterium]